MAFNPTLAYSTVTDAEGEIYIVQNGTVYDRNGNSWSAIPKSKRNGYLAPNAPVSIDSYGRQVDSKQSLMVAPKQTNIATKCVCLFPAASAAHGVNRNTHIEMTTEVDFDAVQVGILNVVVGQTQVTKASLAVSGTAIGTSTALMNAFAPAAADRVDVTWASATSVTTAAAASTTVPSISLSDWMPLSSVPRVDGGTFPLLEVRFFQDSTNVNISSRGPASDAAWRNSVSDGRTYNYYYKDAADATTGMPTWTSGAAVAPRLIPFFIRYRARGQIRTLFVFSDSIGYGQGATNYGEGYSTLLHRALSQPGRREEFANFGWPGQTTATFHALFQSLVTAGVVPNGHVLIHSFSPNDTAGTGTDITAAIITAARKLVANALDTVTSNGGVPYPVNGMPENTAAKGWPTGDMLRIAYNTALSAYPDTGIVDISAPMSGVTNAGQVQIASGLANADNLHPNDAGHAAIFSAINLQMFR